VLLQGAIFVTANVLLVCLAISLAESASPRAVILDHFRHSGPAFVVMGVLAALAVTLWTVDPPLLALLAGPLLTLGLYQRYALSARVAEHAAATDSLTELKNHRSYKHSIRDAVEAATPEAPTALCLVDVDDFKQINDQHGHPAGDAVLVEIARLLADAAGDNEAFRLGGDEFALVVAGGADEAGAVVEALRARVGDSVFPGGVQPTISVGIAECPGSAKTTTELERVADLALYWTKRHGKDRSCVYSAAVVELSLSQEIARTAELDARLRAAENLIHVVDARDTYTGYHSQRVAHLAEAVGQELGLDEETRTKLRLAALLHDLGKIAVPDQILQKPDKLTFRELMIIRRHPVAGRDLLAGLDVAPVDKWILHHHEHWDGSGYPHGLRGEQIPIGSRIILVADAYDAMTSDRAYRPAGDPAAAIAELAAGAGKQFDRTVVEALTKVIGEELEAEVQPLRAAAAV
jgi:diguanylate cyclase (GGDEF)-like protein/putative nucleotidyltransferase with HDIG domain